MALEGSLRDILRTQGTIALFVFLYLSQVIFPAISNLEDVIFYIQHLDRDEKLALLNILATQLNQTVS